MLLLQFSAPPRPARLRRIRARRPEPLADWSPPEALDHLARIASIPHVVDFAARLPASARLRHVAFVAELAFGGVGIDARVGRRFVEDAYRATTSTAKRVATDLSRSLVWDEWEGCCLLRACAVLTGRLRAALTTAIRAEEWTTSAA